jgi:hypothetical protein
MIKKKISGQISTEMIIIFGALFIAVVAVTSTLNQQTDQFITSQTELYAKEVADSVSTQLNAVYLAGGGTTKTIELPNTLRDETPYALAFLSEARLVELAWVQKNETKRYTSTLVFGQIGGNVTNINDDIIASSDGETVTIIPTQEYTQCDAFCSGNGYTTGTCRKGVPQCTENGETFENDGNSFCITENAGVCCCAP